MATTLYGGYILGLLVSYQILQLTAIKNKICYFVQCHNYVHVLFSHEALDLYPALPAHQSLA